MSRILPALSLQLLAAGTALSFVAIAPPTDGQMLIIPLAGQSADAVAVWATAAGARLVGRGPLPGSLTVEGSAANLLGLALSHGTLVVAAPPTACGARR